MVLALNSEFPLLDLFWTMLLAFGLALLAWTIVVVFRDLFGRTDISPWWKTLWVLAVLLLPIVGSLVYLLAHGEEIEARRLRRRGAAGGRPEAYLHGVSGADSYRGVHDVTRTTQAWSGPIRPA